jgi:formylglycine-generating enzyme required for sulfatase activity
MTLNIKQENLEIESELKETSKPSSVTRSPNKRLNTKIIIIVIVVIGIVILGTVGPYLFFNSDDGEKDEKDKDGGPNGNGQLNPPSTPIITLASNDNDGNYEVTWTDVSDASSYSLEEDDNPSFGTPTEIFTGASNSKSISGKLDGTFYYRVKATNIYGDSPWSDTKSIKIEILNLPSTPSISLESTDTDGNYEVSWSSVSDADSYTLEEDDNPSFSSPTEIYTGTATLKSIIGKSNGTYFYRVKAANENGDSPWSVVVSIMIDIPHSPSAPTITLASTDTDGNYEVSWSSVSNADSYALEEDDNPSFSSSTEIYSGTETSKSIIGKSNGTFYYRVKSTNDDGDSPWSVVVSIIIDIRFPPSSPTITLASTDTDGSYEVSWSSVSNADSYALEEDDNPSFSSPTEIYNGTATSKSISSKNEGTYYYRVKATNEDGASPWSNIKSIVVDIFTIEDLDFDWVKISPGSYMMGVEDYNTETNSWIKEHAYPQHKVTIGYTFYMSKFEVTQAQWEAVMNTTPWSGKMNVNEGDNYPATYISWYNAINFINKLNQLDTEHSYRLPSEAEWEYCCRAGSSTNYSCGNNYNQLLDYAWVWNSTHDINENYPHQVGTKLPNPWGLYDMHGNAYEWCQDEWHENYTGAPDDGSVFSDGVGARVYRGGDFDDNADYCRSAYRDSLLYSISYGQYGIRVVLEA